MKTNLSAFISKEFKHIFRDLRTTLILIVMPVVLIFLLGFAMSTDVRNVSVVYLSEIDDPMVERTLQRIESSEYFTLVGRVSSPAQITEMMRSGKADAAVRFNRAGMQIVVDASNPNIGASEAMYLQNIIAAQLREESRMSIGPAVNLSVRMLYNPRMQSAFNFIPGILGLILILICAMMTSISIVREKENGTMEVLLTSPVRPLNIIFAKMVPYFVLSCVNIATILLIAKFILGVPLNGSVMLIVGFSLLYTIMALSLGLLISTLTDNQTTALLISAIVLMIPVMMLSGMMFPITSMPRFFQVVSCIVPARWFIDAMRKLMIEGLSFAYVMKDGAILLGMTLLFISVALKNFKNRL